MFMNFISIAGLAAGLALGLALGGAAQAQTAESGTNSGMQAQAQAQAQAQQAQMQKQAQAAALQWLALSDGANYAGGWDQAADLLKSAVGKSAWESALLGVRGPLGAVRSRQLKSALFTRSLPGAPAGDYVVLQFETDFEHKAAAIETVTPMKQGDGAWRVAGYFIK
jgi:hypothetical protein